MPVVTRRQKAINDFVEQFQTEGEDFFNELLRTTANVYADKYGIKGLKSEDICTELTMLCQSIHSALAVKFCETLKDDEEFNEECEECGAKMSSTKLTEEEFDEHPDREAGYCKHTGNWFCMKCRDFEEGSDESDEED